MHFGRRDYALALLETSIPPRRTGQSVVVVELQNEAVLRCARLGNLFYGGGLQNLRRLINVQTERRTVRSLGWGNACR